jgi:hypothetical protein
MYINANALIPFTLSLRAERGNLSLQLRDCFVISCLPQAGTPRKDIFFNAVVLAQEDQKIRICKKLLYASSRDHS